MIEGAGVDAAPPAAGQTVHGENSNPQFSYGQQRLDSLSYLSGHRIEAGFSRSLSGGRQACFLSRFCSGLLESPAFGDQSAVSDELKSSAQMQIFRLTP